MPEYEQIRLAESFSDKRVHWRVNGVLLNLKPLYVLIIVITPFPRYNITQKQVERF